MTARKTSPPKDDAQNLAIYSIGKVSEITDINAITLRAWERRYNIVSPQRTAKGHRLYTDKDIEVLNSASQLVSQGIQISRVKSLLASKEKQLLDIIPPERRHDQSQWLKHKAAIFEYINTLDLSGLESIHEQLFANYTALELGYMVCRSILGDLRSEAQSNPDAAGHFHIYHTFLGLFISRQILNIKPADDAPKLMIIDQSDKPSSLRMQWYVISLRDEGYNPLLIDRQPLLEAIPAIASKYKPQALIIYNCKQVPFDILAALEIPIFIANNNENKIKADNDRIKTLPYGLKTNIEEVKKQIPISSNQQR